MRVCSQDRKPQTPFPIKKSCISRGLSCHSIFHGTLPFPTDIHKPRYIIWFIDWSLCNHQQWRPQTRILPHHPVPPKSKLTQSSVTRSATLSAQKNTRLSTNISSLAHHQPFGNERFHHPNMPLWCGLKTTIMAPR